jgi:hypothetical protein
LGDRNLSGDLVLWSGAERQKRCEDEGENFHKLLPGKEGRNIEVKSLQQMFSEHFLNDLYSFFNSKKLFLLQQLLFKI